MVLAGVNDREQTTLWCGGIPREFVAGDLDKAAAKMRQVILPTAPGVSNEGGSSRVLVPLPAVSRPWVLAWGLLEPSRRGGQNAQKTGKNGAKMGEIRPKKCEGRELTKDQLAGERDGRLVQLPEGAR